MNWAHGSRINERFARNGQTASRIFRSSLSRAPHCLVRMRLNGTPWSENVFRIALANVPVAFPIAMDKDAGRVIGSTGSWLTFHRQFADQKELGPCDSSWPIHWARLGISRNQTKPVKFFYEIQNMLNLNGLRPDGQPRRSGQHITIVRYFNIVPRFHHASDFITTMASRYLTKNQGPHDLCKEPRL